MKVYEKFTEERVSAIKCDCCGVTYDDHLEMLEFFPIKNRCGYASVFGDGNKIEIDVCQYCMKNMLEKYCDDYKKFIEYGENYE